MKNITRLSIWPELEKLGFVPIRFRAHGKIVAVGAALQQDHIDINNKPFKSDVICITPTVYTFFDKRNYHIVGDVKSPFLKELKYYITGKSPEIVVTEITHINHFYTASDILKTIQLMLKEPG